MVSGSQINESGNNGGIMSEGKKRVNVKMSQDVII